MAVHSVAAPTVLASCIPRKDFGFAAGPAASAESCDIVARAVSVA
jgi:hypothetical protein